MKNKGRASKNSCVDPTKAKSFTDKEIIIENIDLANEIVQFLTDTTLDKAEAIDYLEKNGFNEYGPTEFKPQWQIIFEENQRCPKTQNELVVKQLTNIVTKFREVLTEKISPFGDTSNGYEIMKLNEEIHDVLYGLKLYSYGIPYSENVRKYASHFYSNLFIKSQDTAIELLILNEEPKKQEKPQDVSKAGRSEKKNKHKKRKEFCFIFLKWWKMI